MDNEKLAIKLQEVADRSTRNEGRIKKLEGEHEALHQLATSVAVMAEQMKNMQSSVNELSRQVGEMEGRPGKRWEQVVDKLIFGGVAALIGAVISRVVSMLMGG